ncbi:hypothetical protein HOG21_01020 [bacterium]|nr:hypothetical protein [bacterium]
MIIFSCSLFTLFLIHFGKSILNSFKNFPGHNQSTNAITQTVDINSIEAIAYHVFVEFSFNNCKSVQTSLAQSFNALYILAINSCGGHKASHKADIKAQKSSVAKS